MSFESELSTIRATGAKLTEQDVAALRQRYESDVPDIFNVADAVSSRLDGKNPYETEEVSDIPQEEKDALKKYVYTSAISLEYPLKVGERDSKNPEQLHSVRFSILARENSRVAQLTNDGIGSSGVLKNAGGSLEVVEKTEQNNFTADQDRTISLLSASVAGAAIGFSLAGSKASGAGKLLSGFLGGSVGAGLASAVVESVRTVRTLGQINLHISQPPVARYSANWENKELGPLAGMKGTEFNASDLLESGTGVGELGIRGAIKAAANLPSSFGIGGELGSAVDLASAKVANPYKEQLFTSMGFRQFAFNYKFAPKNETEYNNVRRIIDLFKYHMHPENDPTGLFLEYPSEFEIEYCYNGSRNEHLNKISQCALTDIKVTYGNQDAFTTFMGTNGAPVEINLELAFTELETLTNNRIADGF